MIQDRPPRSDWLKIGFYRHFLCCTIPLFKLTPCFLPRIFPRQLQDGKSTKKKCICRAGFEGFDSLHVVDQLKYAKAVYSYDGRPQNV